MFAMAPTNPRPAKSCLEQPNSTCLLDDAIQQAQVSDKRRKRVRNNRQLSQMNKSYLCSHTPFQTFANGDR